MYSRILANSHYGEEAVTENVTFDTAIWNGGPPGENVSQQRNFRAHSLRVLALRGQLFTKIALLSP